MVVRIYGRFSIIPLFHLLSNHLFRIKSIIRIWSRDWELRKQGERQEQDISISKYQQVMYEYVFHLPIY